MRESSPSSCVLFVVVLWLGLRRSHAEGQQPPNPKGWILRSRRTSHLDRPPGRPCRKSPRLFVLSLTHSLECSSSGLSIHARTSASLNANAVDESTTAGGLEAASLNACGRVDPRGLEDVPLNARAVDESTTAGDLGTSPPWAPAGNP